MRSSSKKRAADASTKGTLELLDPLAAARSSGLCYVSDAQPGITRERRGKHLRYRLPGGELLRDEAELARIRALAIPPAWDRVWIGTNPRGHILATGRDARGRKQYRYHPAWRAIRDATKFHHTLDFAAVLPTIRRTTSEHLERAGLGRERVLATIVRLLEETLIRVGNEEYARDNGSYGLTTMLDRHAAVRGQEIVFTFRGKSGKQHSVGVRDRKVARIVKRLHELPGAELFQYVGEDGETRSVSSHDVNEYLREVTGRELTAKDFRTWAGTVLAARELRRRCDAESAATKKSLAEAIALVAQRLGNTPTVCRKSYVHPDVIESFLDGTMSATFRVSNRDDDDPHALRPEERALVRFLTSRAKERVREAAPGGLVAKLAKSVAARSPRSPRAVARAEAAE